jgi:hypothetical protein
MKVDQWATGIFPVENVHNILINPLACIKGFLLHGAQKDSTV